MGSGSSFTCFECDTGADSCKRITHKIPKFPSYISGGADNKSKCWSEAV